MKAFVTGATGFPGRQLVQRLLEQGDGVGVMVPDGDETFSGMPGITLVRGLPELVDPDLPDHLDGVKVLYHCDAWFDLNGTPEGFRQVNVTGPRLLLDAAMAAGVSRFVHLSSESAGWDGHKLLEVSPSPRYPAQFLDSYSKSRAEAEKLILATVRAGRIEAVILRPGWTWGPGDVDILPRLVRRALKSALPLVGEGNVPIATTYVDHLVDALIAAGRTPGISGKVYYVSDERGLTLREFLDLLLGAVGIVPQYGHLPGTMARAVAAMAQAASSLLTPTSPLLKLLASMAEHGVVQDVAPARNELGYRSRVDLEEALANLTAWAQSVGGASRIAELGPSRPAPSDG